MKILMKLTWVDLKISLRNWITTFFTLVFPVLMLFLFGSMYGNKPTPMLGGYGSMDVTVPGYIVAMVIGTTGMISLPLELTARRQQGVLRRFRATPLSPAAVLISHFAVNLVMSLIGTALLIIGGVLAYKIVLPPHPIQAALGFLLVSLSVYAMGFVIASLVHSVNAARAITMAIFYPMMFLCGGTIPLVFLPAAVKAIARWLPLTYGVNLFRDLWFGNGWDLTAIGILSVILFLCALISIRFFKWE